MENSNLNVLVVGGAGFLGSKLTKKWLDNGNKVTVVDNLFFNQGPLVAPVLMHPNCTFVNADAESLGQSFLSQFDLLYLFQCYVGAPLCSKLSEKEVLRVNVDSVAKILSQLSESQRVIGPISNSGYGSVEGICTEETPLKSLSLYGVSKEKMEQALMEKSNSTSIRLATVWGHSYRNRIDLMVNQFTYNFVAQNRLDLFQGDFLRNFVHIDDVIDMFFNIATDKRTFGQIYNFGQDDDNTSKEKLARFIASKFPEAELSFLEKVDPDKRNYNCSSAKLAKLGHKAKITIESGIDDLIKFYRLFPKYGTDAHEKLVSMMKNA